ncbi:MULTISPECIES: hypothetical protein [unclassified Psychrobacter]|uniref:hypothetical protein n=1 Tax=unclassified Psychrobacter TaxID=196806 RepID=UPI0018F5CF73|nr:MULTISPECIES: hypothetical protein [unclassified Psychrobacter]
MGFNLERHLAGALIDNRQMRQEQHQNLVGINDVDQSYEAINQMALGTPAATSQNPERTRQQIYAMWQLMQKDPQVSEALSLHVTAALGCHESTGDMVFISPHDSIRTGGQRARELRERVEREAKIIAPILNRYAVALATQAVGFGDSYARILFDKKGVKGLISNQFTIPPLIMPFERAGETIGYHILEAKKQQRVITKLNAQQMLRFKMPRIDYVPQTQVQAWQDTKAMMYDSAHDMPILPAEVGGSFLYKVEDPWRDVTIARAALNNQQIADSVKQTFLTVNMEGMPNSQQRKYFSRLTDLLKNYRQRVRDAFAGKESLWGPSFHIVPQYGEKQILQSVGDMSQRMTPLTDQPLMLALRQLAGGLGMDLSLIGWADMLAGGLGDGAAFHTSAQIMRRSPLIRSALTDGYNHLMSVHWGIKYGKYFAEGDYPWQINFYSDQTAAATQALTNRQNRANTTLLQTQVFMAIRELGLDFYGTQMMLEDEMGYDSDKAARIAKYICAQAQQTDGHMMGEGEPLPEDMEFDYE